MDGWIKLHRKLTEHEIMQDHIALQIFVYFLLTVNRRTGTLKTGRYYLAKILGQKPSTVYSALRRLSEKYKIINIYSNNRFSEIKLLQWSKYNVDDRASTPPSTTRQQRDNTKQEEENGEHTKEKINKKKTERNFNPLSVDELYEIAFRLRLEFQVVQDKQQEILDMELSGELLERYPKNKTMKRTLGSWLNMGIERGYYKRLSQDLAEDQETHRKLVKQAEEALAKKEVQNHG